MTTEEVLALIERADYIYVGAAGSEGAVYFPVSRDIANNRAADIAGLGLKLAFSTRNSLYIGSV